MESNILQKVREYLLIVAHMLNILHKKINTILNEMLLLRQKKKKKVIYMRKTTY